MKKDTLRNEAGIALVTVVWVLLLLSAIATVLVILARGSHDNVQARRQQMQLSAVEAAIWHAVIGLLDENPETRWPVDGSNRQIIAHDLTVTVRVTDEAGRADLNTAEDRLLTALFQAAGIEYEQAVQLTDRVRDWTDADDLRRLRGAERNEYRLAGKDYMPQNRPFRHVEELRQVLGIDLELYNCIAPGVTVYSGRYNVDVSHAPQIVQAAQAIMTDSQADVQLSRSTTVGSLNGRAVRIRAMAALKEKEIQGMQVVVRLTGNAADPYWILDWQRFSRNEDLSLCSYYIKKRK
jgi:general secretion pathway protein K